MGIRSFVPPIAIDLALAATRSRIGFTGYDTDFDAVAAACSGYEDARVVQAYRAIAVASSDPRGAAPGAAILDAREARLVGAVAEACLLGGRSAGISLVDLGGAHGGQYRAIRRVLGDRIERYAIVESPAVADGLGDLGDGVVSWLSTTPERISTVVGRVDVAVASSTVQYLPSPESVIAGLAATAPHVVLDRVPVIDHHEHFVMRQHTRYEGAAVTYPAWFLSEHRLLAFFESAGLRVVARWYVPEDAPMVLRRRRPNSGYLLETPLGRATATRP